MERKIIFKAKRLDNGEWAHGDLLHTDDSERVFIAVPIAEPNTVSFNFQSRCIAVGPNTICQSTGIYDKDGNDIYENDIILNTHTKTRHILEWNAVYCCYSLYNPYLDKISAKNFADYRTRDMLIVGNIYDKQE